MRALLFRRFLSAGLEIGNEGSSSFKNPETKISKIGNGRVQSKIGNAFP